MRQIVMVRGVTTDGRCSCRRCRASDCRRTSDAISARLNDTPTRRLRPTVDSVACRPSPPAQDTRSLDTNAYNECTTVRYCETASTRSPAVARTADRTAPVVKLTLTQQAIIWQKNTHFCLNRPIMRQNEAYQAIFCTLKTTSGFIFLLPVV